MKMTKVALAVGLLSSPFLQAGEFISAQNPDSGNSKQVHCYL